jgi:hypothetical protein
VTLQGKHPQGRDKSGRYPQVVSGAFEDAIADDTLGPCLWNFRINVVSCSFAKTAFSPSGKPLRLA